MKIKLVASMLICYLCFFSCKKEIHKSKSTNELPEIASVIPRCPTGVDPVIYYSEQFLEDSTFEVVIDKFGNNALDIIEPMYNLGGLTLVHQYDSTLQACTSYGEIAQFYLQNGFDTAYMLTKKAEILASLVSLYVTYEEFYSMSQSDQIAVFRNVLTTLSDDNYRTNNPHNPLVITYETLAERANVNTTPSAKLYMEEISDCLLAATTSVIANSWSLVRNLYNIITGYNLGWSGIIAVCKSALRTALNGSVVTSLAAFGLCVAWNWID